MYFPVSSLKLVVMSLCTFGIYEIYWFYKNWCIIQERERLDIIPFGRAFFAYFFCYSLFKKTQVTAETRQTQTSIDPGPLAAGWIVLTFLWKLPDPYWLITFFCLWAPRKIQHAFARLRLEPKKPRNCPPEACFGRSCYTNAIIHLGWTRPISEI